MMAAAKIGRIMEIVSEEVEIRQKKLLLAAGLPTGLAGIQAGHLIEATLLDKKAVGGKIKFVIPLAIGRVVVKDNIPVKIIEQALDELEDS
jgi:3-dehydroquinate synthase